MTLSTNMRRRFGKDATNSAGSGNVDTSAWHNYTWGNEQRLKLVCFRSNGELSVGMPT